MNNELKNAFVLKTDGVFSPKANSISGCCWNQPPDRIQGTVKYDC